MSEQTVSYQISWKFNRIFSIKEILRILGTFKMLLTWFFTEIEHPAASGLSVILKMQPLSHCFFILCYFEGPSALHWLFPASWNLAIQLVLVKLSDCELINQFSFPSCLQNIACWVRAKLSSMVGYSVPAFLYEAVFDMVSSDDEGRNLQAGHFFFYCIY